ncbi:hypothetical protein PT7_1705 [Pusillimonas sp. T7-7]|nr:hypothetical protein PT7_1705 [Pusillimonas sp. T7-7]
MTAAGGKKFRFRRKLGPARLFYALLTCIDLVSYISVS